MRILFTCYPSNVHVYPLAPIAWALQSAGHEVRVATHEHPGFAGSLAKTGLTSVSLGDPEAMEPLFRADARPPAEPEVVEAYVDALDLSAADREHWICLYQYILRPMSDYARPDLPYAAELIDFAAGWKPDLVIWDAFFPAGAVAARTIGAAHARFLGSMLDWPGYFLKTLQDNKSRLQAAGLAENPLADIMRPLAERYDVPVDDELLIGQWTIDPLPKGVRLPTDIPKVAVRWVPFAFAETLQPWLFERPERPRISLSLGESMRRVVSGDFGRTPKLLEAVADLDVEVVATLNELQLDGVTEIPGNVRTVDWMPLTQLLPTCTLHIHHGGNGTALAAVASKVPQIVTDTDESTLLRRTTTMLTSEEGILRARREYGVAEETDESETTWEHPAKHMMAPIWSDYVTRHGAGVRMNYQKLSAAEIRDEIQRVLGEPSFQKGAGELHDAWLAMPSPNDIVSSLERLAAEHRGA